MPLRLGLLRDMNGKFVSLLDGEPVKDDAVGGVYKLRMQLTHTLESAPGFNP